MSSVKNSNKFIIFTATILYHLFIFKKYLTFPKSNRNKSDDKNVTDYSNVHKPVYVFWTWPLMECLKGTNVIFCWPKSLSWSLTLYSSSETSIVWLHQRCLYELFLLTVDFLDIGDLIHVVCFCKIPSLNSHKYFYNFNISFQAEAEVAIKMSYSCL